MSAQGNGIGVCEGHLQTKYCVAAAVVCAARKERKDRIHHTAVEL